MRNTQRTRNGVAWMLAATLGGSGDLACGAEVESAESVGEVKKPLADKPVESRGYGTRAESEPPRYVRLASETGYEALQGLDWLQLGADYRARYEVRHHDYRRDARSDDPLLLRTRLYLGIQNLIDPLRLGVELQDARVVHSDAPDNNRDIDEHDLLQAYVEFYGRDWLGQGEPLRLQAGRMTFEYLDRRLISRNPWRNTTNSFEGLRLVAGSHEGRGWLDLLAVHPVTIEIDEADDGDEDRQFYGALGSWNGGSEYATLQPYALLLDENHAGSASDREIYTWGLRGYRVFASGFDYDVNLSLQTGNSGGQRHRAEAGSFELGYTWAGAWKPRLSGFVGYASGDEAASDNENNRYNRLFGFGRPWSANDYQVWENLLTPKLRIELKPGASLQLEGGYGAFWLASDTDSWTNAGRRDRNGHSGAFIGHEVDSRVRWRANPYLEVVSGYAHFFPGAFTQNTGPSPQGDFFYLELNFQLFK